MLLIFTSIFIFSLFLSLFLFLPLPLYSNSSSYLLERRMYYRKFLSSNLLWIPGRAWTGLSYLCWVRQWTFYIQDESRALSGHHRDSLVMGTVTFSLSRGIHDHRHCGDRTYFHSSISFSTILSSVRMSVFLLKYAFFCIWVGVCFIEVLPQWFSNVLKYWSTTVLMY